MTAPLKHAFTIEHYYAKSVLILCRSSDHRKSEHQITLFYVYIPDMIYLSRVCDSLSLQRLTGDSFVVGKNPNIAVLESFKKFSSVYKTLYVCQMCVYYNE